MPTKTTKPAKPAAEKPAEKPIGEVTRYYGHLGVAIVRFTKNIPAGTPLKFKGATTDFEATAASMQLDHAPIDTAPKGKEVGIKVTEKARQGDKVYAA